MFQSLGSPNSFSVDHPSSSSTMGKSCGSWGFGKKCSYAKKSNVLHNVFKREVHGLFMHRLKNPFGDNGTPDRLKMSIEQIIPTSALEAGNIFMGFTNCGRYLLSYTCRPTEHFGASVFDSDASYMYTLHIWLFTPYKRVRKVSQVPLFDNNGVYDNNLLIEISQWDMDDNHLLVTGHSVNPDSECHHTFYTTITTIPEAKNCPNCVYLHDDELEDDVMLNNSRMRANCILHGLTIHIKNDHVSPYPKLNADVQLRFKDSVLLNTGNVIHLIGFKLCRPSSVKPETTIVPNAPPPTTTATTKVPLRCDLWLKISNANIHDTMSMKAGNVGRQTEGNITSLNNLEYLLSIFPNSTSSKAQAQPTIQSSNEGPIATQRRLSQSSTDSEFSIFSPKSISACDWGPPMSPPFLNKPRSPRHGDVTGSSNNNQEVSSTVSPSKLMLPPQERKFFKRRLSSQSLTSHSNSNISVTSTSSYNDQNVDLGHDDIKRGSDTPQQNKSAFDVFEMRFEDTATERHLSSFKTFRKRRLADKKYEFKDADISGENIVPLKMTRRNKSRVQGHGNSMLNPRSPRNENENAGNESPRGSYSEISHPRSPRAYHIMSPVMSPNYNNETDVLRPLNNNLKVKVSSFSPSGNFSGLDGNEMNKIKEEDLSKDCTSQFLTTEPKKNDVSDTPSHPHAKPTMSVHLNNCVAKVLRSYIQKEDDNMSVITDIEDELCQGYPFPVALPLEVHGAGYQQLQMISNSKAEKFQVPVVQVLQRSLEIEMLCNEVGSYICLANNKHLCSCLDYDLVFADADPDRGTVTAIVVMLVQAIPQRNSRIRGEKPNISCGMNPRRKYETLFTCEWAPDKEHIRILYKGNLRELESVPDPWHPTEDMESIIKTHMRISSTKKTLSNTLAVHDWQSLSELVDAYGIVTLFKDDGSTEKTERRLNDFNSLIYGNDADFASVTSTTTDSDDEWGM